MDEIKSLFLIIKANVINDLNMKQFLSFNEDGCEKNAQDIKSIMKLSVEDLKLLKSEILNWSSSYLRKVENKVL